MTNVEKYNLLVQPVASRPLVATCPSQCGLWIRRFHLRPQWQDNDGAIYQRSLRFLAASSGIHTMMEHAATPPQTSYINICINQHKPTFLFVKDAFDSIIWGCNHMQSDHRCKPVRPALLNTYWSFLSFAASLMDFGLTEPAAFSELRGHILWDLKCPARTGRCHLTTNPWSGDAPRLITRLSTQYCSIRGPAGERYINDIKIY